MEEVVSAIVRVVEEIVKAVETDRTNSKSCLDLAARARTIGHILPLDSSTASMTSRGSGSTARNIEPLLERLKAALDDALKLVQSQESSGFLGGRVKKLVTSRSTAAKFQSIETRITACVVDVGLAEQFDRYRARHHKRTVSAPAIAPERHHKSPQFTPPPSQHQQSTPGSSQQHESSQPTTSPLQQRRSPRLLQQDQSFRSEEWSTQQQRSSHTTTPLEHHQQQRRQQLAESSSQQQQNSQAAVRSPQQPRSRRQLPDSQPAAPHHRRRSPAPTPNLAWEIASAIRPRSSQPAVPPRGPAAP